MVMAKKADAIAALDGGDTINVTHPSSNSNAEKTHYRLVRDGRRLSERNWRTLFDDLEPVADGLFGTDMAQSYRLKEKLKCKS